MCWLNRSFEEPIYSFKVELHVKFLAANLLPRQVSEFTESKSLAEGIFGSEIDLECKVKELVQGSYVLIYLLTPVENGLKLTAWTFHYLVSEQGEVISGLFWLPLYYPPVKPSLNCFKVRQPMANAKVFLRVNASVDLPRCIFFRQLTLLKTPVRVYEEEEEEDSEYTSYKSVFYLPPDLREAIELKSQKRADLIEYARSGQHKLLQIKNRFFERWKVEEDKRKDLLKRFIEVLKGDLETISKYLRDEKGYIERTRKDLSSLTEKYLHERSDEHDRDIQEEIIPYEDNIRDLEEKLRMFKDSKRLFIFDELAPGARKGIRVMLTRVDGMRLDVGVRLRMKLLLDGRVAIDDVYRPVDFCTNRQEEYLESPAYQKLMAREDTRTPVEIPFDQEFFILKEIERILKDHTDVRAFLIIELIECPDEPKSKYGSKATKNLKSYELVETRRIIGGCALEIKHSFGSLNFGRYKLPVHERVALEGDGVVQEFQTAGRIDFIIESFDYSDENYMTFMYRLGPQKKKAGILSNDFDKHPFYENLEPQFKNTLFGKGGGIDVYIDSARYLPDSVTVSKLVVRFVDSGLNDVHAPQSILPDMKSPVHHPAFNFRCELRFPFYDSTTMMLLLLLTLDFESMTPKIVGSAFVPLFLSPSTLRPSETPESEYILRNGAYQIPLYCEEYYQKKPFLYSDQKFLDRLPCASLLVRILEARRTPDGVVLGLGDFNQTEWEAQGVWPKPPKYYLGKYCTLECPMTKSELQLFEALRLRPPKNVFDKAIDVVLKLGKLDAILAMQQNNDQLLRAISNCVNECMPLMSDTQFIDFKFAAKYSRASGFKFTVDGFHNLPRKGIFIAIFCLSPPATLYSENHDSWQTHLASWFDWDSPARSPIFKEEYIKFDDVEFRKELCAIVDVREVIYSRKGWELKEFAWTVVPLFTYDGFCNSGHYQFPLFKGKVRPRIIKDLQHCDDPWRKLNTYLLRIDEYTKKPMLTYLSEASVLVRLIDGQREGHIRHRYDYRRIDHQYLPQEKLYDYAYNEMVADILKDKPKLSSLVPKNMSSFEFNKDICERTIQFLKLDQFIQNNVL